MIGKCLHCGEKFDPRSAPARRSDRFTHSGPFTATINYTSASCPGCGKEHGVTCNHFRPDRPHAWLGDDEIIPVSRMSSFGRSHVSRIDGTLPVDIHWAWVPITDSHGVSTRLASRIASDASLYNPGRHSLLVVVAEEIIPEVAATAKLFSAAVAIPGLTSDTFGPYASILAERSISRTFAANLASIKHYWPAVTLNKNWYRALSSEPELVKAYARHRRRGLSAGRVQGDSDE